MPVMGKSDLSRLIPHGGAMCLLDAVEAWDRTGITCRTSSHRDGRNPLRRGQTLEAICGLEYAAQAMAVHVGLLEGVKDRGGVGYLGSIKRLILREERLDQWNGDLTVRAERVFGHEESFIYTFLVSAEDRPLLEGQASIFLKPAPSHADEPREARP
jgi:predicted hotdog family 3-hydroxylacyl-ACP dehydratase